jgi:phosphoenolpyruvate---glycerone phosphotransferase subunit DhaK
MVLRPLFGGGPLGGAKREEGDAMKKLINRPEDAVKEELEGVAAAHAGRLVVHSCPDFITRADAPVHGKVALVSGGGSGHEPMHGGFVGMGMLDAACPGEVFTSPTPDQMLEAARAVDGGAGVLLIVKNYTGDVMNFEMAAELLRGDGVTVETAVIDDDVAVKDSLYTAGRRGVGATVLAEKVCGAAAEQRRPLAEVAGLCRKVNAEARSMGVALTSCTVPAAGKPTFLLGDDEMEFGVGIHGEPGRERRALAPARQIVEELASAVLADLPFARGDRVLAFVNGMGGTPLMELYVVYGELHSLLKGRGIAIARNLVGSHMTSLDMAGCSITLLRLDDELTALWDAPVNTPGLRWGA